jgi:hypothetical protein
MQPYFTQDGLKKHGGENRIFSDCFSLLLIVYWENKNMKFLETITIHYNNLTVHVEKRYN